MTDNKKLNFEVSVENLPDALASLPGDINNWETELANALNKQYKAEQKLSFIKSQTEMKIRTNPVDYGNIKLTEGAIGAIMVIQPEVQAAESELIEARLEVSSLRAITNALDAKRSACKYLSELLSGGKIS